MNLTTHVYCTNCKNGEELITKLLKEDAFLEPTECIGCCSYNPEDSMPFSKRPNYEPIKQQ